MPNVRGLLSVPGGATIRVSLGPTRADMARRRRAGVLLPSPVRVSALIDTGAEVTCISQSVANRLALPPRTFGLVNAPGVGGLPYRPEYEIDLAVPQGPADRPGDLRVPFLVVMEVDLTGFGCDAVLGRDVLALCVLIYDGTVGSFTLSY